MTDKEQINDSLKNSDKNFNENSTQENQREEYYKEYLKLSQECKELKKGYAELTEIVNPYMDDFTGYNEELGGFDLILCVKELLQQLARKTEECEELKATIKNLQISNTKLQNNNQQLDGAITKAKCYEQALEEIEKICVQDMYIEDVCLVSTCFENNRVMYDIQEEILNIINKAKGDNR